MSIALHGRQPRLLVVVCALLTGSIILSVFDMDYVIRIIRGVSRSSAELCVGATTLASIVLRALVIAHGIALLRRGDRDTSDEVNRCQSTAIAAAGFSTIDWIVDSLADNTVNHVSFLETVTIIVLLTLYYRIVKGMQHTTFWDSMQTTERLEPYLAVGKVVTELSIDPRNGHLRPLKSGEAASVSIITAEEYLDQAPAYFIQQILHSLNNVRRSSCIQLGDTVVGNVYIPTTVQRAAGFDADDDIGFSYQFRGGHLTLIMDEEGLERTFLAQSLVDQYLDKTTALTFIPEMIVALTVRLSDWIREYEDRLARLESSLGDDVYEMPTGLTEFVNEARRNLGAVQGFCRQVADMLEDLTQVANNGGYEQAASHCAIISRQISRMALDAEEVRDMAGEIRAGYQERIEVRQNNVMSILTIVETVFTPLALVTGWYGMNFVNMPELKLPDAYFIVAALLILMIALELATFKRRRWF